jgi:hypothetical protein
VSQESRGRVSLRLRSRPRNSADSDRQCITVDKQQGNIGHRGLRQQSARLAAGRAGGRSLAVASTAIAVPDAAMNVRLSTPPPLVSLCVPRIASGAVSSEVAMSVARP